MSNFYNVFGQFVSTQTIETFVSKDDKIDNTKILNNIKVLKVQIETGSLTKEQVITEIEKLNSLKMNKDTSDEVKNAIELLVKDTVSKVDGIKLEGNMELTGVVKSRGFYLTDGTKVNEVDKLAIPIDKEGHLTIVPPTGKKVTINELHVTSNTGLKVTGHDKTSSFGSLNSGWCHITTTAPNFHMNKNLTIEGGINATGGRTHFKDVENKGRVRVGAAWGIPGLYSEDNQDIVVGVPSDKKVNIGTDGKFVEITGTGNMKVPSDINTPVLSRIGGDWLRINQQTNSAGKVAAYGGFSINDTRSRSGGLSVGSWAPPGQGNIKATGSIGASGINIINGKNNRGNSGGDATYFNYMGKGENYIRGYTIHQGELRILNPKNENNSGDGTHFNHEGNGRNYIRGKTEMKGDVNFIGNITTDSKICINNTCITEEQIKSMLLLSDQRPKYIKHGDVITIRSGKSGKRLQEAANLYGKFDNHNQGLWEKMKIEKCGEGNQAIGAVGTRC